jgi:protein-L-isoaspartate(D-aspartate) O-methyltransferase
MATGERDPYEAERRWMVESQLRGRDIRDERVLATMAKVPRHLFVPEGYREEAYQDTPLPIGFGQTISQPYMVALMTELLELRGEEKVLEIGTGSGYQTAVLAELAGEVYSVEVIPELSERARRILESLGYRNFHLRVGDGYEGWPEHAPYDGILVTAAPVEIPPPLLEQLADGGRMAIPVGETYPQQLYLVRKQGERVERRPIIPCLFVPLVHRDPIADDGRPPRSLL